MQILNINKNNWSGENVNIKCFKNAVKLYAVCGVEKWETFKIVKRFNNHFSVYNQNWDYALLDVIFDGSSYSAYGGCTERESNSIHTAIAQALFNIL